MAANIESQVRVQLREFESLVTACRGAGSMAAHVPPGESESFGYVVYYLTEKLAQEFELLHVVLSHHVLPLVADIKSMGVRHG